MKILLMVLDSMRADAWPYNTRLEGAVRYSNCYSCAAWTVPSAMTLLTGLMPHEGLLATLAAGPGEVTLFGRLRSAGWRCEASWLPGVPWLRSGWDELWLGDVRSPRTDIPEARWDGAAHDHLLEALSTAADKTFLLVWYKRPHFPYRPQTATAQRYGLDGDWNVRDFIRNGNLPVRMQGFAPPVIVERTEQADPLRAGLDCTPEATLEELEYLRLAYRAHADDAAAMAADAWQQAVENGWLVVVTGDHGEQFMEHGRLGHWGLDPENIRVPLFASDTPQTPRGPEKLISHLAVARLIASWAGIALPKQTAWDYDGLAFAEQGSWGMQPREVAMTDGRSHWVLGEAAGMDLGLADTLLAVSVEAEMKGSEGQVAVAERLRALGYVD